MKQTHRWDEQGFTIIELLVSCLVIGILAISSFSAIVALNSSALLAKQKSIATELATNEAEYLRSLPYDNLAVLGGAIYHPSPLPATKTQTINGYPYVINTSINYIDDSFDGCANYPSQAEKELYCRNYSATYGAILDQNPADYKIINVKVVGRNSKKLADIDTQVSARVAETNSTTGAMLIKIVDSSGNPISGADVDITNTSLSPAVNLSDSSDSNGTAIVYSLPPDTTGEDYTICATKTGYTSLCTIKTSGLFQPNFPSQNVFSQQSSSVTLVLRAPATRSLVVEVVNSGGSPVSGLTLAIKGGYKKYINSPPDTNFEYYFTDSTRTTDGSGFIAYDNLPAGDYIFCGDNAQTGCLIGVTNYRITNTEVLHSTVDPDLPSNSTNVPENNASPPPPATYPYGGFEYQQKVKLTVEVAP